MRRDEEANEIKKGKENGKDRTKKISENYG
jgi:hypothetical protein